VNRGVNKTQLDEPEKKGKMTKATPIRLDVLISEGMKSKLDELSKETTLEPAAVARMLLSFALKFANPFELDKADNTRGGKAGAKYPVHLSMRATPEIMEKLKTFLEADEHKQSVVIKLLLDWSLKNLGNFTLADWLNK